MLLTDCCWDCHRPIYPRAFGRPQCRRTIRGTDAAFWSTCLALGLRPRCSDRLCVFFFFVQLHKISWRALGSPVEVYARNFTVVIITWWLAKALVTLYNHQSHIGVSDLFSRLAKSEICFEIAGQEMRRKEM